MKMLKPLKNSKVKNSKNNNLNGLDGCHICAAMTNQYCMINYKTGDIQDLFPYNNEHTKAIVKRIGKSLWFQQIRSAQNDHCW
ncbi:transforming growth factor-beta receptor-associated protein 1 homolog [Octopus bimaculoides]|uniref:transforming growth factor-beta receptor-associated protein 1 homolog n=1 Tax=Octopus bimaculoides TaxID=37653 RepID=UPI0022E413C4|nr:transforming growth factor-beta receptor-associated protein 1 homolog [Octopus bimaculoides]